MTLRHIVGIIQGTVVSGSAQLDTQVDAICAADLMSDALAFAVPGSVLLTGLCNPQVVRTAAMADLAAVAFVRGKIPSPETISLADELGMPLVTTNYSLFEVCGRLYGAGLRSVPPEAEA